MKNKLIIALVIVVLIISACSSNSDIPQNVENHTASTRVQEGTPQDNATYKDIPDSVSVTAVVVPTPTLAPRVMSGQIVYTDSNTGGLRIMNADGSGQHQVDGFANVDFVKWSNDLSLIVVGYQDGGGIYVLDAESNETIKLLARGGLAASWSPDGTGVAVDSGRAVLCDNFRSSPCDRIVSDGNLKNFLGEELDYSGAPAWSPNGDEIAFVANEKIVVSGVLGNRLRIVSNRGHFPAWSPDGSMIVYFDLDGNVMVVNKDGSNAHSLVYLGDDIYAGDFDWSERGIVFASYDDSSISVYIIDNDGAVTKLADDAFAPSWIP